MLLVNFSEIEGGAGGRARDLRSELFDDGIAGNDMRARGMESAEDSEGFVGARFDEYWDLKKVHQVSIVSAERTGSRSDDGSARSTRIEHN